MGAQLRHGLEELDMAGRTGLMTKAACLISSTIFPPTGPRHLGRSSGAVGSVREGCD